MSQRALQRALVIALHDPAFLDELRRDPTPAAWPWLGLDAAELAELARVDPRALRTDPLRARRVLRAIADEYRASTTIILSACRRVAALDGFFRAPAFRDAIVHDRPLVLAFGAFLAELAPTLGVPQLRDVLALERARAASRRAGGRLPASGVGLAPGVTVIAVDRATLPSIHAVERWLFELGLFPQVALAEDAPRLPPLPPPAGAVEHLLVQPVAGHTTLTPVDDDLARVLAALASPRPRAELAGALAPAGVPEARAADLVERLLLEGLLAEGVPAGAPLLAGRGGAAPTATR